MARTCRPIDLEPNQAGRFLRRLHSAWLVWRIAGQNPFGEATWRGRDHLVCLREDGRLESVAWQHDDVLSYAHPLGSGERLALAPRRRRLRGRSGAQAPVIRH